MRESALDKKIKKYAKSRGDYIIKIWGGGFMEAGIPDLILCVNGRFVAFEDKVGNNKTSELQKYHIRKIIESGGIAMEMRDFEHAKQVIEDVRNGVI